LAQEFGHDQDDCQFRQTMGSGLGAELLREHGLHPGDLQTFSHATMAGAEAAYYVVVPGGEAASAQALLKVNGYERHVVS
jgi:hypothetical protein